MRQRLEVNVPAGLNLAAGFKLRSGQRERVGVIFDSAPSSKVIMREQRRKDVTIYLCDLRGLARPSFRARF
jgi:hypothetical protein